MLLIYECIKIILANFVLLTIIYNVYYENDYLYYQ